MRLKVTGELLCGVNYRDRSRELPCQTGWELYNALKRRTVRRGWSGRKALLMELDGLWVHGVAVLLQNHKPRFIWLTD